MDTKGQVYILAALLLILVIFGLATMVNVINADLTDNAFEEISKDYERESSRFLTHVIGKYPDLTFETLSQEYIAFTLDFTRYSRTQNPHFGLLYLFDYEIEGISQLFIGNYLNHEIVVSSDDILDRNDHIVDGCGSQIQAGYSFEGFSFSPEGISLSEISMCNITLDSSGQGISYPIYFLIGDILYISTITASVPEVIIASREDTNNQRRVFLNEEFMKGKLFNTNEYCSNLEPDTTNNLCRCEGRDETICTFNSLCIWNKTICQKV